MKKEIDKLITLELQKRERIMVIAAMIFSLFAFYKYIYSFQEKSLLQIEAQIKTLKAKELENEKTLSNLQIKSSLIATKPDVQKEQAMEQLNNSNNMSKMLQSIVEGIQNELFALGKISLEGTSVDNKIRKSTFNIALKSSFTNLSKFLDQLEKNSNWLAIEEVNLSRVNRDLRECEGVVRITTYEVMGGES